MKKQTNKIPEEINLEIRGILRVLSEDYGQSIASEKRLLELIKVLKNNKEVKDE